MTPHTGGRTILSHAADPEEDGFRVYTGMIVNCVLYLLFFAWLLIKGEPRYSDGSKNVASYKMYMKNADADMARVNMLNFSALLLQPQLGNKTCSHPFPNLLFSL